jgi:hypothetical protein
LFGRDAGSEFEFAAVYEGVGAPQDYAVGQTWALWFVVVVGFLVCDLFCLEVRG